MSNWSAISDAWMTELTTNVSGLSTAIQHKYAPWSVEEAFAMAGERHIAIWPQGEAEAAVPYTTEPSVLATQVYSILVWEDASQDIGRLTDNETADKAWLTLAEGIRARLLLKANISLGVVGCDTRYQGVRFDRAGAGRMMEVSFRVQLGYSYA